jgi:hypothetical protein
VDNIWRAPSVPTPFTSNPDNHTECRENTTADHAAYGHRPCRVEAELRFRHDSC